MHLATKTVLRRTMLAVSRAPNLQAYLVQTARNCPTSLCQRLRFSPAARYPIWRLQSTRRDCCWSASKVSNLSASRKRTSVSRLPRRSCTETLGDLLERRYTGDHKVRDVLVTHILKRTWSHEQAGMPLSTLKLWWHRIATGTCRKTNPRLWRGSLARSGQRSDRSERAVNPEVFQATATDRERQGLVARDSGRTRFRVDFSNTPEYVAINT